MGPVQVKAAPVLALAYGVEGNLVCYGCHAGDLQRLEAPRLREVEPVDGIEVRGVGVEDQVCGVARDPGHAVAYDTRDVEALR